MNILSTSINSDNWEETINDPEFSLSDIERFIDESYESGYDAKDEETRAKLKATFDKNMLQTNQITETLLAYLKELNIHPIDAYLKIDNIFNFSIIFTVGLEDYISSQLLKAYDWVNHTERETRNKNYTIDLSFMHGDENLNLECLILMVLNSKAECYMYSKKLHALHNSKACDLLIKSGDGEFNDWIVTTAFYSALHLVHHHLFPLILFRREYKTFDAYYKNKYSEQELPKHTVTKDLVNEYLFVLSSKYNWLFKECYNARYRSYNVHEAVAITAKEYLEEIKSQTIE